MAVSEVFGSNKYTITTATNTTLTTDEESSEPSDNEDESDSCCSALSDNDDLSSLSIPNVSGITLKDVENIDEQVSSNDSRLKVTGSTVVPYSTTIRQDGKLSIVLQSITAMPQYEHKSFEELRLEDYTAGNKGTKRQAACEYHTAADEESNSIPDDSVITLGSEYYTSLSDKDDEDTLQSSSDDDDVSITDSLLLYPPEHCTFRTKPVDYSSGILHHVDSFELYPSEHYPFHKRTATTEDFLNNVPCNDEDSTSSSSSSSESNSDEVVPPNVFMPEMVGLTDHIRERMYERTWLHHI